MHLTREHESSETNEWLPCDLMRALTRHSCVIRLHDTGAVMAIELTEPLDITRACLACALLPVSGHVRLGAYESHRYTGCVLRVQFQDLVFPEPMSFKRKPQRATQGALPHAKNKS